MKTLPVSQPESGRESARCLESLLLTNQSPAWAGEVWSLTPQAGREISHLGLARPMRCSVCLIGHLIIININTTHFRNCSLGSSLNLPGLFSIYDYDYVLNCIFTITTITIDWHGIVCCGEWFCVKIFCWLLRCKSSSTSLNRIVWIPPHCC